VSLPGDEDEAKPPAAGERAAEAAPADPSEDPAAIAAREQRVNAIWKRIADAIAAAEVNRRARGGVDDDE
jgi:hypothetical protein